MQSVFNMNPGFLKVLFIEIHAIKQYREKSEYYVLSGFMKHCQESSLLTITVLLITKKI